MARSIRSKRGMALRRIKRVRYAKKELFRLNKMLGLPNKEDKSDEDVEMTTEVDEKRGLTSKDYRLLKKIVKDGSDSEDSDVEKTFEEVMVMTSSKFLRRKCQAMRYSENKRQLAKSNAAAEIIANGDTHNSETTVPEDEKLKRKHDAVTFINDFGSYPKWMNQKKIQALAKANRSMKVKKMKRLAQKHGRRPSKLKAGLVSDDDSEKEDDNSKENVTAAEGLEMETDDVTSETTKESAKVKGKKGKKVEGTAKEAVKTQNGKRGRKGKKKETTEDAVEIVDLSD